MKIDANVQFGFDLAEGIPCAIDDLMASMDARQVDCSLISNLRCQRGDSIQGNRQTKDAVLASAGRLVGMIAFSATQYFDQEATLNEHLSQAAFAGIRFHNTDASFMSGWGSSFDSLAMRLALDLLASTGKIAFLEGGYAFSDIAQLCQRYSEIPFIVSGTGYVNLAEAILAAKICSNLYLEISTLDAFEGVTTLCNELGPNRIIFGTGWPYASPTCAHLMVERSGISPEDQGMVFAGNLGRLLQGARNANH